MLVQRHVLFPWACNRKYRIRNLNYTYVKQFVTQGSIV